MKQDGIYETRPFIFLALGLFAVVFSVSGFMSVAGWVLIACASAVIHARMRHRGFIKK